MSTETTPISHVQTALELANQYSIQSEQNVAAAVIATMQHPDLYPTVIAATQQHHQALKNIRDGLRTAVSIGEVAGSVPAINAIPFMNLLPAFEGTLSFFANLLGGFIPEKSAMAPSLNAKL